MWRGIFILAMAKAVWSQEFSGEPACAISCFSSAVTKVGCDAQDLTCQCQPHVQDAIFKAVAPCLLLYCTPQDKAIVASLATNYCTNTSTAIQSTTKTNVGSGAYSSTTQTLLGSSTSSPSVTAQRSSLSRSTDTGTPLTTSAAERTSSISSAPLPSLTITSSLGSPPAVRPSEAPFANAAQERGLSWIGVVVLSFMALLAVIVP